MDYEEMEHEELSDEEIEETVDRLLEDDPEDLEELDDFISEYEDDYSENLNDYAFRQALRCGARNYVKENVEYMELNDVDGSSSYLDETDDPDLQELLMDNGAFRSLDDYSNCRFAMETVNGDLVAFDKGFRKEVLEKYLAQSQHTEQTLLAYLNDGTDADCTIGEVAELLGIVAAPDGYDFINCGSMRCDSYEVKDLLEELDYECSFEGDSWSLGSAGVFFIK